MMSTKQTITTASASQNCASPLAMHLAGCIGMMLFKLGDISGVYPTERVAQLIDKELPKFGV